MPRHGAAAPDITVTVTGLRLDAIARYPVKSLAGERLDAAMLSALGVPGDRLVHVRGREGVRTARKYHRLLGLRGTLDGDGVARVDGHVWHSPAALALVREAAGADAWLEAFDGPERFDVLPLLVATDGAIAAFGHDHRRLRPNLVIGGVPGLGEREWPGGCLRIGRVRIGVQDLRLRCIMTSFDPDTLVQDKEITRSIYRRFEGKLALNCFVIEGGELSVGDEVTLLRGRACAEGAAAAVLDD